MAQGRTTRLVLVLCLLSPAAAVDLSAHVPVAISFGGGAASPASRPTSLLDGATVTLCLLDWAAYRADPSSFPMFRDLLARSHCDKSAAAPVAAAEPRLLTVPFPELEHEYELRGCGSVNPPPGCVPSGMVFHESRCGSTLVANMLAVLPESVAYSESAPPFDILSSTRLSEAERVRALRVIVAAMGRPIAVVATGRMVPHSDASWSPYRLYFKFQSALAMHIGTVRRAFPAAPWAFVHRNGVEVMASLFRGAKAQPASDAVPDKHVLADDPAVRRAPCMRHRDHGAPPALFAVTGANSSTDIYNLAAEDFCAASVALLCASALHNAADARALGLGAYGLLALPPLVGPATADPRLSGVAALASGGAATSSVGAASALSGVAEAPPDLLDGRVVFGLASRSAGAVVVAGGIVMDGIAGRGSLKGHGQGIMVDFRALPDAVIGLAQAHFGVPVTADDIDHMFAVGIKYSKARGGSGDVADASTLLRGAAGLLGSTRRAQTDVPSMDQAGNFVSDSRDKQGRAWPALRIAAARFLSPLRALMLRFNPPVQADTLPASAPTDEAAELRTAVALNSGAGAAPSSAPAATGSEAAVLSDLLARAGDSPGAVAGLVAGLRGTSSEGGVLEVGFDKTRHQLPLGQGYPMLFPLSSILAEWSSDVVSVPPTYGRYSSLRVFDWATERDEALRFRRAEQPFVLRGVPSLVRAASNWSDDAYLLAAMGADTKFPAEVNEISNHFMYWNKGKAKKNSGYVPPTTEGEITPRAWLSAAAAVDRAVAAEERAELPAWWFAQPGSDAARRRAGVSEAVAPPLSRGRRTLHYMRASTDQRNPAVNAFITRDLRNFDPVLRERLARGEAMTTPADVAAAEEAAFFLVDEAQQRGVHCRYGMPGIIAEAHYDGGRNFITMQRGSKRYVLSPPSECAHLHLLRDGPSARHSEADWSDPAQVSRLGAALGTEIVIEAGDALYVPALWFHYITSLTTNVQCNTRSGTVRLHEESLKACGFAFGSSEEVGKHTDLDVGAKQATRSAHAGLWRGHWPAAAHVLRGLGGSSDASAHSAVVGGAEEEALLDEEVEESFGAVEAVSAITAAAAAFVPAERVIAAVRSSQPAAPPPVAVPAALPPSAPAPVEPAEPAPAVAARGAFSSASSPEGLAAQRAAESIASAREWSIGRRPGRRRARVTAVTARASAAGDAPSLVTAAPPASTGESERAAPVGDHTFAHSGAWLRNVTTRAFLFACGLALLGVWRWLARLRPASAPAGLSGPGAKGAPSKRTRR